MKIDDIHLLSSLHKILYAAKFHCELDICFTEHYSILSDMVYDSILLKLKESNMKFEYEGFLQVRNLNNSSDELSAIKNHIYQLIKKEPEITDVKMVKIIQDISCPFIIQEELAIRVAKDVRDKNK